MLACQHLKNEIQFAFLCNSRSPQSEFFILAPARYNSHSLQFAFPPCWRTISCSRKDFGIPIRVLHACATAPAKRGTIRGPLYAYAHRRILELLLDQVKSTDGSCKDDQIQKGISSFREKRYIYTMGPVMVRMILFVDHVSLDRVVSNFVNSH